MDRKEEFRSELSAGKKETRLATENKWLKSQIKLITEQLEETREGRGLVLPERTRGKARPKLFCRLWVSDTHGSHIHLPALTAMLQDIEHIEVREVVLGGDHIECGGFLTMSHTLGYVAQMDEVGYGEDVNYTNDFLDKIQSTCPKADIYYLEGNHEQRVERWCVDAAIGHKGNAEFLMRALAPRHVLNLEKRGIKYIQMSKKYCGLDFPGILKLGQVYCMHGFSAAKHAAAETLRRIGGCVYYAHTHRADYEIANLVHGGVISAHNSGCMCQLMPLWNHTRPNNWSHGYNLTIVNESSGTFFPIPVPIVQDQSFLKNLWGLQR